MTLADNWTARRSGNSTSRKNDNRDPYERDYARVIHSVSFRRLQAKTQVFGVGESDFYQTRLTHSLEVAQIGCGIVKQLFKQSTAEEWHESLPDLSLIETICLAHDLGHPPFGHGGEIALNHMMRGIGGFEGNGQTLRIISKLDNHTETHGMDLTRRAMLGVLKYPVNYSGLLSTNHKDVDYISESFDNHRQVIASEWKPPKCYFDEERDVVDWILEPFTDSDKLNFLQLNKIPARGKHDECLHKSFDASIMELADAIACAIHDLEDAISLKLITKELWNDVLHRKLVKSRSEFNGIAIHDIRDKLFSKKMHERKEIMGDLINWLITGVKVKSLKEFESPLLKYKAYLSDEDQSVLTLLKDFVKVYVIKSPQVQMLEYKGQQMVMAIFEALISDPNRLLPAETKIKWAKYKEDKTFESGSRVICDYVSGMTDDFATRVYKSLFVANDVSVFTRL